MSQRVPSWDVDDPPFNPSSSNLPLHRYHPSGAPLGRLMGYEVAELAWENGQLALHGLVPPRTGAKPRADAACSKHHLHHHPSGTLESVVNQATGAAARSPVLEGWLRRSASVAVDALVPCQDDVASNRIADPDAPPCCKRARMVGVCSSQGSAAGSLPGRVDSTTFVTLDTWREDDVGLTATATTATTATATDTSAWPETENTSLGKRKVRALYDHVSISHTSSQTKPDSLYDEEEKDTKREVGKPSGATKKSRAAAVHNQSERKRRDRINQRMKTLQKLVPNSSKIDKASMLDEVIEYLKQLQAQVQMMSRMSSMMVAAMPQLQMPMVAQLLPHMAQFPQLPHMGLMDFASIGRSVPPVLPLLHPSAFLHLAATGGWDGIGDRRPVGSVLPDPFSGLLACQMAQQPMSLDEYSRMVTLLQHLSQNQSPANLKSSHYCRICKKGFGCGRALGGHMRAHGIVDDYAADAEDDPSGCSDWDGRMNSAAAGTKRMYALRTNPARLRSCRHGRCSSEEEEEEEEEGYESVPASSRSEGDVDLAGWSKGKRSRRAKVVGMSEEEDLASCLMMLSAARQTVAVGVTTEIPQGPAFLPPAQPSVPRGTFECKACKKVFSSHQALGGHRASHKKNVAAASTSTAIVPFDDPAPLAITPLRKRSKVHECSICHRVFTSGQALGGHKRCHWITSSSPDPGLKLQPLPHHANLPHQLTLRPMFDEPLDLNQPARADEIARGTRDIGSPLRLQMPAAIYLQAWIDRRDVGRNRACATSSDKNDDLNNVHGKDDNNTEMPGLNVDDEVDSNVKRAKLSELKDINMGEDSSPWLQVGIGSSANESSEA
ncbi:unnamed protein product [Musa hybrid cultivar]